MKGQHKSNGVRVSFYLLSSEINFQHLHRCSLESECF